MHRTKIVCTIGPASGSGERLEGLINAGMNVARLNFSHGDHEQHRKYIMRIRRAASKAGRSVAILQDLAGPKVRIGPIADAPVELIAGQEYILTSERIIGDAHRAGLTYKKLPGDVKKGDHLLLSDGEIGLRVVNTTETEITCRVLTGGALYSRKGINLPDRSLNVPILSGKDRDDLAFGLSEGVDYVAVSFVRSVKDIMTVRRMIKRMEKNVPVIAKIEKHEAIRIMDDIIDAVDGIMVARGDMGVEVPLEKVPRYQKTLIAKANKAGKPVITATQMLKSMVDNPRPTRAEVSDVANAVLDGSDAIMLSEETAVGQYPVDAVKIMARITEETEKAFPFRTWHTRQGETGKLSPEEALACSAGQIAAQVDASAIVTFTQSGSTTRLVAKYRPSKPIIVMTPSEETYRRCALIWGAHPIMAGPAESADDIERQAVKLALQSGLARPGDRIVVTAGVPLYVPGTTNLIRIIDVPV